MTETFVHSLEARILGRVFTHDGTIHFVLDANPRTGMARCSRRTEEAPSMTWLPSRDVQRILNGETDARPDDAPNARKREPKPTELRVVN